MKNYRNQRLYPYKFTRFLASTGDTYSYTQKHIEMADIRIQNRQDARIEPEKKNPVISKAQPKNGIKRTATIVGSVFVVVIIILRIFAFLTQGNSYGNVDLSSQHFESDQGGSLDDYANMAHIANAANHESESAEIWTRAILDKRDSKSESKSKDSKSTPPLDEPLIRFLLVLGGFIVLNMLAICVHHIFLKATKSEKSYKTVEQSISPF